MARVNIDILGIHEPNWTGIGQFNSDNHYISSLVGSVGPGEGHALIFSCEYAKTATIRGTTINRRMLDPTKKIYPMPKGKGEVQTRWGGGYKITFKSNTMPTRDARRAQIKPCVHQDPGIPQETEPDLPLSVWVSPAEAQVSSGLPQGQGLRLQQTWEPRHVSPTIKPRSRQPTEWRTIIPKKFLHCCKVLGPTTDFPSWGSGKGLRTPREFECEGQWDLITELPRTGETDFWRTQAKPCT